MLWIIVILLLLCIPLVIALRKPPTLRIQRSARIAAPPEAIYSYLDNFRAWTEWSPWERIDTDMDRSYSGAESGVGAAYAWSGKKAGAGNMDIQESTPPERLTIRLEFERPYRAVNEVEFRLRPEGTSTEVTWTMEGPQSFLSRVMSVFINLERMVGKDFESGLQNLREIAERQVAR